jgi:predicted ester cyclase
MAEGTGLIKRFYEDVIADGDLTLIDELTTEGLVDHEEGLPGQPSGREGVKYFVSAMREAFPDIRPTSVEPMLADGDLEAARVILTGTHQGEFLGVGATGTTVEFESIDIIRVENGLVAEHWGVGDTLGLMQQLGAIPD